MNLRFACGMVLVTLVGSTALAQDAPTPAPAPQPAQPAPPPPPGFPPPPPPPPGYGQYQQPYQGYQQTPYGYAPRRPMRYVERNPIDRPLSFSAGIGPGFLACSKCGEGPNERDLALTYTPVRIGVGIAPGIAFTFSYEGSGTTTRSPATDEDSWLHQNVWLFGLQVFANQKLYLRGGLGWGALGEETNTISRSSTTGLAFTGGIGYELLQHDHVALALEANYNVTRYTSEIWHMGGVSLVLALF